MKSYKSKIINFIREFYHDNSRTVFCSACGGIIGLCFGLKMAVGIMAIIFYYKLLDKY